MKFIDGVDSVDSVEKILKIEIIQLSLFYMPHNLCSVYYTAHFFVERSNTEKR